MQNAALLWHVSLLVPPERKGLALGLVGLARVGPVVVFSMLSGVVADAWDRRRLMLMTQAAAARVALALAVLTFRGLSVVWPIYVLAALGAAVGAFDLPARQALMPMLVPREHLPNAISLNTIMFQAASVGGPAIGGLLIASTSVAWAYVCQRRLIWFRHRGAADDARRARRGRRELGARDGVSLDAAREGLRFVFRSPLIRSTMLLDFFATFFCVGHGAAADLRAGHPARRRRRATAGCLRLRPSARWSPAPRWCRSWTASSGGDRASAGGPSALRPGDGRLRPVAIVLADVRLSGDRREPPTR